MKTPLPHRAKYHRETIQHFPQICLNFDRYRGENRENSKVEQFGMCVRGLVLLGFSAACLGAAGLAYQEKKRMDLGFALANSVGKAHEKCKATRIETPFGVLGCVQTVTGRMPGY